MRLTRRHFVTLAAAAGTGQSRLLGSPLPRYKAVALDAFTVLDPRPIAARAEELFPGKGSVLMELWRTRQFEYTWLRTITRTYVDFRQITEESLVYAASALSLDLPGEKRSRLLQCFSEFRPWPDALAALQQLKRSGIRLIFLSNFTEQMLASAVESSRLQGLFEPHLSTDRVRTYKPDPHAYQMAEDELKLKRDQIVFAAFAGWDAAGAKAFGLPTFWVNRTKLPVEELGLLPDAMGHDLQVLARFVNRT